MSEFWEIKAKDVNTESNPQGQDSVGEFRLKLMEIADKVEAGVYDAFSFNFIATNFDDQKITVGEVNVAMLADGNRASNWSSVEATIPDREEYKNAWDAYMEDIELYVTTKNQPDYKLTAVGFGSNRSDGDTTAYIEETVHDAADL